jgi:hypothetical protein
MRTTREDEYIELLELLADGYDVDNFKDQLDKLLDTFDICDIKDEIECSVGDCGTFNVKEIYGILLSREISEDYDMDSNIYNILNDGWIGDISDFKDDLSIKLYSNIIIDKEYLTKEELDELQTKIDKYNK